MTVSSSDPVDSRPVTVNFIGRRDGEGPAATGCCDALNFFTGRTSAEQWMRQLRGEGADRRPGARRGDRGPDFRPAAPGRMSGTALGGQAVAASRPALSGTVNCGALAD
ncbi:hypothetical protein ABZS88_28790 [Streptomyces sp. NPDC005480]|uniref:hypothetical protein n=1 Tax=Streptomyces sp. NPDC005480 TaxID=3154880 RepID=UPI0033A20EDF